MCPQLTFHHIDQRAHITFLNDAGVFAVLHRVHAVHDLMDLGQFEVLHEIIVQDGLSDHVLRPVRREEFQLSDDAFK